MPSPRRVKKSVRKSARKVVRKSARKVVRKSAKKSVRKSARKTKRSYRMDPTGGDRANLENMYNERLNYLRSLPKPERQRAISKMLVAKYNPNPDEMRLEKRLLRQLTEDVQRE